MRAIDPTPFMHLMGQPETESLGDRPMLAWIAIVRLRIDPDYQREILRSGARNIGKIARKFNWSLFGIVVVAALPNGLYAIVDGQHRTVAAAMRGIAEVPCVIISADPKKQAEAFAAINGSITAISALAVFHANVAAGDASCVALNDICKGAGVEICKYPVPASHMKRGQTLALRALQDSLKYYGGDVLEFGLRFILGSKNKSPGILKAQLIKAVCHVLDADRAWMGFRSKIIRSAEDIDLLELLTLAEVDAKKQRRPVHVVLGLRLFEFFEGVLV